MTTFTTNIVKTKQFNKIFIVVFFVLYLLSTFYIFLYDDENKNTYLKYAALAIYLLGLYFLFGQSFIKPKKLGTLKISNEKVEFEKNGHHKNIVLDDLENIYLKYTAYGSWYTHSIFGNKNYIVITEKSGEKSGFEILIKNKASKNELKQLVNSPEFYNKFYFTKINNSRTEF